MEKNLNDVFRMFVEFYIMASDIAKYYSQNESLDGEDLVSNIEFDLRSILEFHFGEDNGVSVGVDDEEDAARSFIDVLVSITEFMTSYIDPTMLLACLHENNLRVSKDLITTFSHDGIDTIETAESVARAYAVLGECASDSMKYSLSRTPLNYFETSQLFPPKNTDAVECIKRIKAELNSSTNTEYICDAISGTIEQYESGEFSNGNK